MAIISMPVGVREINWRAMWRRLLSSLAVWWLTLNPAEAQPLRVVIETEAGAIEVQVEPSRAPTTVANFLRYVDAGLYDGGRFHRAVTLRNQVRDDVKIEVIQGGRSPEDVKA